MRHLPILALVALLTVPTIAGAGHERLSLGPVSGFAGPLGLPTEPYVDNVTANASRLLGQNLTREDVRLQLDINFTTLDFDLIGLLFGGGTFEANARLELRAEFRALSVSRLDAPLDQSTAGRANFTSLGVGSQVLTADMLRSALAGEALAIFEAEQERLLEGFVQDTLPELRVLSTRFDWKNTNPIDSGEGDDAFSLTDPPIVLDAKVDLQYLRRESLLALLDAYRASEAAKPAPARLQEAEGDDAKRDAMLERLRAENAGAFYERSAFDTFGITQLVPLTMPPGWDLRLDMRLPKGYTFEYASADVDVDRSMQQAGTYTFAGLSRTEVENPVAVSLSNRYLVTVALLCAFLLVGTLLRVPVLLGSSWLVGRTARRQARAKTIPVIGGTPPQQAEVAAGQRRP